MSRIGKKPVIVPQGVKVEIKDNTVLIEGTKGKLSRDFSPRVKIEKKDSQLIVERATNSKIDRSLHGLTRALLVNMIKGVTEGFSKQLEIIGVGFRAQMQGVNLNMQLGFSHPVIFKAPEGVKIEAPKQNIIVVSGTDKEKVGKVASEIRMIYPPEPYKGKGIRYLGEFVKKKIGKAQATGGK